MSDHTLRRAVMDELEWDPRVDTAHLTVAAREGDVTLAGRVASDCERLAALQAAFAAAGVRSVSDRIIVDRVRVAGAAPSFERARRRGAVTPRQPARACAPRADSSLGAATTVRPRAS